MMLKISIPEEYWGKDGWSLVVRFRGKNNHNGNFQIFNANIYNIKDAIKLANSSKLDVILDCSSDLDKYSEIINSFNVSNNYVNVHKSNKLQQYKKKLDLKSININHYHELYNQLLKINGF